MRIARAFLSTWLAAATALGACVFAFTLVVDPYRMLDLVAIEPLNASRPKAVNQTSIAKAYGVARAKADVVLVGNSRVDVGFAAEDPLWARLGGGASMARPRSAPRISSSPCRHWGRTAARH